MSEEKNEPRLLIKKGLFPDVMKALSDGVCIGLSEQPRPGAFVFTVAMEITETKKDAKLIARNANNLVVSDGSVRAGQDYEMGECQTCTLQLTIGTGVTISSTAGVAVKVHREKSKCFGWPTIVIE
jgi:hypothetical protein